MSEIQKKEFDSKFQAALSGHLQQVTASGDLRSRILASLKESTESLPPADLDETVLSEFETSLSKAIQLSQDVAPESSVVLRTEAKMSAELKKNILSERSVSALIEGAETPAELESVPVPAEKVRFIEKLRSEITRSSGELVASEEVRKRILDSLSAGTRQRSGLIPFPSKSQWRRGLSTLTSLAAGFALVFLTLFGSADVALANSVRADHQHCCRGAMAASDGAPPSAEAKAMLDGPYGPVPVPPIDDSWKLRVSKICKTEQGQPMVHLLYTRIGEDDKMESLSFHFLPDQAQEKSRLKLKSQDVEEISGGDFPVIAWLAGGWVCTACSDDMDVDTLKQQANPGL